MTNIIQISKMMNLSKNLKIKQSDIEARRMDLQSFNLSPQLTLPNSRARMSIAEYDRR